VLGHAEPESEFQAEQVQGAFGGPQAPSVMDANIAFESRQVPVHLTNAHCLYFESCSMFYFDCAISI
jgi:hypothetical protein